MAQPGPGDPSVASIDDLARSLGSNLETGLTAAEAARPLAQDGENELIAVAPVPAWRRVPAAFQDPLFFLFPATIASSQSRCGCEQR